MRARMKMLAVLVFSVLLVAAAAALVLLARPEKAQAATFTVTSAADSGAGTLREAINQANAIPGPHSITFNIPGGGLKTIAPATALPVINQQVAIDGASQPGTSGIGIQLSGSAMTAAGNGLWFGSGSDGSDVSGLAIYGFSAAGNGAGIYVTNAVSISIHGNHIGTDAAGNAALGNSSGGIIVSTGADNIIVGGSSEAERNIISANQNGGIQARGGAGSLVIKGNYIGTDAAGENPLGNTVTGGICLWGGGDLSIIDEGNVISGNEGPGIFIADCSYVQIKGNLIGTASNGLSELGNEAGIACLSGADHTVIGGAAGDGNRISHNGAGLPGNGIEISGASGCEVSYNDIIDNHGAGVYIYGDSGSFPAYHNRVSVNSIYGNGALGIDLADAANHAYAAPVFSSSSFPYSAAGTPVSGTAPAHAEVEIFKAGPAPDPSGSGEGLTFLASTTADAGGAFSATLPGLDRGDCVSAVAIRPAWDPDAGDTSEFSVNARVGARFYFAEGYTGPGFQEYLCLGQPGGAPSNVDVTYLFSDSTSFSLTYPVPANSRFTVDVNAAVGPDRQVSILCEADTPFIAERPMYFDYTGAGSGSGWTGGHDAVGAPDASRDWYFAEGYTGIGFEEYICVLNPGGDRAELTFHFQTREEGERVMGGHFVEPHSRASFKANDLLGGYYEASLRLHSDQAVVAERPMYFDYTSRTGGAWTGGHCVMGTPSLSNHYYLAEGTTRGGFEEWLTLQNPNSFDITVNASYLLRSGPPVIDNYTVAAGTRYTVYVPDEVGYEQDVSIFLASGDDFLAERPMYFSYSGLGDYGWTGGHCAIGTTSPETEWFFAEGYTGTGFDEYLCIQNPGASDAVVDITYYPRGGIPIETRHNVAFGTRYTVNVNLDAGQGLEICARVVSDQPVIVERPMYFLFQGKWDGGHDVMGFTP